MLFLELLWPSRLLELLKHFLLLFLEYHKDCTSTVVVLWLRLL
jgi:hypothetical protein